MHAYAGPPTRYTFTHAETDTLENEYLEIRPTAVRRVEGSVPGSEQQG